MISNNTDDMLRRFDLRAFTEWCDDRHLVWSIGQPLGPYSAMILEARDPAHAWQRMRLVLAQPELRIENEEGDMLARASDLPALLDAVDGGVADLVPALGA